MHDQFYSLHLGNFHVITSRSLRDERVCVGGCPIPEASESMTVYTTAPLQAFLTIPRPIKICRDLLRKTPIIPLLLSAFKKHASGLPASVHASLTFPHTLCRLLSYLNKIF